ncbi:hypothetical protein LCGC14_1130270 [marine sediment metagenome]|uniref:Uncharacterized protein n=1 Tax=marine sediment metagenome TaxID=412755 RepID=A0A0F9PJJ1_9ZZZZ
MKRKLVAVKIDETDMWHHTDPEKERLFGRIFGIYAADLSQVTHCCEFTPSYELHFVNSDFEGGEGYCDLDDKVQEEMHDYIEEGDRTTDFISYFHCSLIDSFPKISDGFPTSPAKSCVIELGFNDADLGGEEDQQEVMEDLVEELQSNPV